MRWQEKGGLNVRQPVLNHNSTLRSIAQLLLPVVGSGLSFLKSESGGSGPMWWWDTNMFYEVPHITMGCTLDFVKGCSFTVFSIIASVNNALKVASLKGVIYWPGTLRLLTTHSILTRIHGLSA